jgi:hypothetical protein
VSGLRQWIASHTIQGALIGVVGAILAVVTGVVLTHRYGVRNEPQSAAPTSEAPEVKFPPPVLALRRGEAARADLRHEGRLRELEPEEHDHFFSRAPRGVFGLADVAEVHGYLEIPRGKEFRLYAYSLFTPARDIEIHKAADGTVRLVGFVSREVALTFRGTREGRLKLTLYNMAWPSADYLVAVSLSEIATLHDVRFVRPPDGLVRALDLELL